MIKVFKENFKKLLVVAFAVTALSMFLSVDIAHAQDFCAELEGEFSGFLDCEQSVSSFTQFQGGLEPPDAEGFDPSITRVRDARTFIKNVANFALGFLGIIAVIVVIYSGFLYVTSRGESDQMEKGKKGITYAIVGIIIILGSFAIVNTVIRAPGEGTPGDGQFVGAPGDGVNQAQLASYNSAAEEVKKVTREFIQTYQGFVELNTSLQRLTVYEPGEFTSRSDFIDYLERLRNDLRSLQASSGVLTNTYLAAQAVVTNVIDPGIEAIGGQIRTEEEEELRDIVFDSNLENAFEGLVNDSVSWVRRNFVNIFREDDRERPGLIIEFECSLPPEERSVDFNVQTCNELFGRREGEGRANLGTKIDEAFDELIFDLVLRDGIYEDYNDELDNFEIRIRNIRESLSGQGLSEVPINPGLNDQFKDVEAGFQNDVRAQNVGVEFVDTQEGSDFLEAFGGGTEDFASGQEALNFITGQIERLEQLFIELDNLKFTTPFIQVNTFRGSAPLIVTFDASRTFDPSNLTIPEDNFLWDPDGNGNFGENARTDTIVCDEDLTKSSIECICRRPGGYGVGLKVRSADESLGIAPGIAYLSIQVTPEVSKIELTADVPGKGVETLRSYNEDGLLASDKSILRVTENEGSTGIEFDASDTRPSENIVSYEWLFAGEQISGVDQSAVTYNFPQKGSYDVVLSVTDRQGNVDRKFFTVQVASIVARINADKLTDAPGSEFVFDASTSESDLGVVDDFIWTVDNEEVQGEDEILRHTFDSPGRYEVGLTVVDARGNDDDTTITVEIESQPPQAVMNVDFPNENRPSLVVLDASQSFDPDTGEELLYNWRIFNATPIIDYEVVSGSFEGTAEDAERLVLLFKEKDTYQVELRVSDSIDDPERRKSSTTTQDIVINNLVDVRFADDQIFAGQLDEALESEVLITVLSEFGDTVEIDFGDGETETQRLVNGEVEFIHSYTSAGAYEVVATARSGNERNSVSSTLIVGGGEDPVAIPKLRIGESVITSVTDLQPIFRNTPIEFDASSSLNSDGTAQNLSYSWNFGDGSLPSSQARTTHVYTDLPPTDDGFFEVTLTVTDQRDISKTSTRTIELPIVGAAPEAQSLLVTPLGGPETPFNVQMEVIGARDRDGRITQYRFYYLPANDPERELGAQVGSNPVTSLEIDTFGLEGEEINYLFCVDITDDDGNRAHCQDLFDIEQLPSITAINGPNESPTAAFTVDRTSVNVGETINFFSEATDPDGDIIEYTYDYEGNNSYVDNEPMDSGNQQYVYKQKSPATGYKVRLKVLDDKGATAQSAPVTIFVDSILDPPTAAFTYVTQGLDVQFTSNSSADEDKGGLITEYRWDFDASVDSDGDGDPRNDVDSEEENPEFTYSSTGVYQATLTVMDQEFNEDSVTREVVVQDIPADAANPFAGSAPDGGTVAAATDMDLIIANPPVDPATDTILLSGSEANVTFSFDQIELDIVEVLMDRDIYFDTNSGALDTPGDGIRNNDVDYRSTTTSPYTTTYRREHQPIRVQVTVIDSQGNAHTDQADIVFRGGLQAALGLSLASNIGAALYILILVAVIIFGSLTLRRKRNKEKLL